MLHSFPEKRKKRPFKQKFCQNERLCSFIGIISHNIAFVKRKFKIVKNFCNVVLKTAAFCALLTLCPTNRFLAGIIQILEIELCL